MHTMLKGKELQPGMMQIQLHLQLHLLLLHAPTDKTEQNKTEHQSVTQANAPSYYIQSA